MQKTLFYVVLEILSSMNTQNHISGHLVRHHMGNHCMGFALFRMQSLVRLRQNHAGARV